MELLEKFEAFKEKTKITIYLMEHDYRLYSVKVENDSIDTIYTRDVTDDNNLFDINNESDLGKQFIQFVNNK
jgi:hypothetical protein